MDIWNNCYNLGWKGLICNEAFSHPAKYSRGLIFHIIEHALTEGWIQPGQTILDPFGGVAMGALPALVNGINWVGCELEPRFVDIGKGCECGGMTKQEWVRFYNRWDRVNYKYGFHWCPRCLMQAQKTLPPNSQTSFFDSEPSASYVRNSGKIPYTTPHHFTGNLELFAKFTKGNSETVLLQGDSRRLAEIVREAVVVVSSPPFIDERAITGRDKERMQQDFKIGVSNINQNEYGSTPGQLANLKEGDISAVVSSPPFAGNTGGRGEASRNGIDAALFDRHSGGMKKGTGDDPANLDHLPMGTVGAVISSPPYAEAMGNGGTVTDMDIKKGLQTRKENYGLSAGQLGAMPAGEIAAVVSSPPFENSIAGGANRTGVRPPHDTTGFVFADYGSTPGQIGNDSGETFWSAALIIVQQCALVLPPGGVAIWVTKAYVKNGKLVDFPGQWRQLCEACGFELLHEHRAMLIKNGGLRQATIDGETISKETKRASFFRLLHEKKRPDLKIDWETVLCMRRL